MYGAFGDSNADYNVISEIDEMVPWKLIDWIVDEPYIYYESIELTDDGAPFIYSVKANIENSSVVWA